MPIINHFGSFSQNHFKHCHAYGALRSRRWSRNLAAGDVPINLKAPEKKITYQELPFLKPEERIIVLTRVFSFMWTRTQDRHLNWIKNVANVMHKAFSTPRYRHSRWAFRVNSFLKRLGTLPGLLGIITTMIFTGIYCSRNKNAIKENMDLFLDAYAHHKLEISVERKWLFQVLAPLVVMNRLAANFIEGAHWMVAATVGFAVGKKYEAIDKMAKTNPQELYRLAKEKMEQVETFIYSVSKKMNAWAKYVQNNPELDNNFIDAVYSDWERLTGIYTYLNTQYTKKRIQEGLSFLAWNAENRTDDAQDHWQGIQNCLKEAQNKYPSFKTTFAAAEIGNKIQKALNDLLVDNNTMRAISHIIQLYRLTGFAGEDEIWNEQNGIVYHYKAAEQHIQNHPELLPSWTDLTNIWMMRMPDEAQKALQKHGQFFPNKPI